MEIPVIATRVGGIPGMLEGGKAGILVEPCSSHSLANAISTAYTNPELLNGLRRAGKELLRRRYSSQLMALQYCRVYESALGSSKIGCD